MFFKFIAKLIEANNLLLVGRSMLETYLEKK